MRTARGAIGSSPCGHADVTEGRIRDVLKPWQALWDLRHRLAHDPIGYCAFTDRNGCAREAKALARRVAERTPDAPPFQTCALISVALEWVLDYAPRLKDLQHTIMRVHREVPSTARLIASEQSSRQCPATKSASAFGWRDSGHPPSVQIIRGTQLRDGTACTRGGSRPSHSAFRAPPCGMCNCDCRLYCPAQDGNREPPG